MIFKYKHNAIPAIIYLLMSIAAFLFVFLAPDQNLNGIGIGILTLPWSELGIEMLDSIHRGKTVPDSMYYYDGMLRVSIVVVGMIINTVILLVVFGYFNKSKKSSDHK